MRLSTSLRLNAQKGLVTPYDPTLTLSLQFATRQAYVSDFGPLPTFTNATTTARTYVGSDGLLKTAAINVPRIEFDPVTRQCLGLLIEEQRQNLTARSEDLTQAVWSKLNVTATGDTTVSPDGNTTADSVTETTASGQHYIINVSSVTSGTVYTASFFVKKGNGATAPDWIAFGFISAGFGTAKAAFNVQTGVFGVTSGITSTKVSQFPNGWWRVSATATAIATVANGGILINFTQNTNVAASLPSYVGQTTSDIFIWGAQFEAGSFASSYIPTAGTVPLVRSADVCSITGAAFTGFYNQTEGAMVFKGIKQALQPTVTPSYLTVDDATAGNRIILFGGGAESGNVNAGGVAQANMGGVTQVAANTLFGISTRYKVNDFAFSLNGGAVSTDILGTVPTVTQMSIGNRLTLNFMGGHIYSIQYFNAIKTNAQLQALSTP